MTCRCCHRTERWADGDREVLVAGGARRPEKAPQLAAFETLLAALSQEIGPIVGTCEACGQPLIAELGSVLPWEPLQLEARGHSIVGNAGGVLVDGESASLDDVHSRMQLAFAEAPEEPATLFFKILVLLPFLFPLALWIGAAYTVYSFFKYLIAAGTQ